jgi:predicted DNA-binding transcriptional regulator AlpA
MNKAAGLEALVRAGLSPRALSRDQAAAYIGVSPCKLDSMIDAGTMPKPRRLGTRVAWDRVELDSYFARLPHDDDAEPESRPTTGDVWDRVAP